MATIMSALREHIKTCPFLSIGQDKGFGVDYLAEDATAYMLEAVPAEVKVKTYIEGSSERQVVFAFSTREAYGAEAAQNLKNFETLENFAQWLEDCTLSKDLPVLDAGKRALRYEVLSSPYAYAVSPHTAQYRIQCRLVYFTERRIL